MKRDTKAEYKLILMAMFNCSNSLIGETVKANPEFSEAAEGLYRKCFFHCNSIYHLLNKSQIPDSSYCYLDVASIIVLARAAYESLSVFNFIFVDPKSEEEKEFRYLAWSLNGLTDAEDYIPKSDLGKANIKIHMKKISEFRNRLKKNRFLQKFNESTRNNILKFGYWRILQKENGGYKKINSHEIGEYLGLSKVHYKYVYGYLSKFAHSISFSVEQLNHPENLNIDFIKGPLQVTMIVMSLMIKCFTKVFPIAQKYLDCNSNEKFWIDTWIEVGTKLDIILNK